VQHPRDGVVGGRGRVLVRVRVRVRVRLGLGLGLGLANPNPNLVRHGAQRAQQLLEQPPVTAAPPG
jgi:hypothetical protein